MTEAELPITFVDSIIDSWRRRYEDTDDPTCVWEVIHICTGGFYGEYRPLPEWCVEYLGHSAENIVRLATGKDFEPSEVNDKGNPLTFPSISWSEALRRLPAALGFSRRGQNRMKNSASDEDARRLAVLHDWTLRKVKGRSPSRARAVAMRIAGLDDERSLARLLARGRKLAGANGKQKGDQTS